MLRIEAQRQARQSPLYFDLMVSWSKDISIFHASLAAAVQRARAAGDRPGEALAAGLLAEVDAMLRAAVLEGIKSRGPENGDPLLP